MFGISLEHLIIVGVILLIFGPKRLPGIGNTIGKAVRNFKDSFDGVKEVSYRKIDENEEEPPKKKEDP